jgi:hypothetical protein
LVPQSFLSGRRRRISLRSTLMSRKITPNGRECGLIQMPLSSDSQSNVGKWNRWYWKRKLASFVPFLNLEPPLYGDGTTYQLAADFLRDVAEIEDWGCGYGGFKKFCKTKYIGIDGSWTPAADKVVDLVRYRSSSEGMLLRHVLEHNYEWQSILRNAVESFRKKMCLVIFTPFSETTREINHNSEINVPDISFNRDELMKFFKNLDYQSRENLVTNTQYKVEHVFFLKKR